MILTRKLKIEGSFSELIARAEGLRDYIVVYNEEYGLCFEHPEGLMICTISGSILLNGEQVLYDGEWDDRWEHPSGFVVVLDDRFLLNNDVLLHEGKWDNWTSHPEGVLIERSGEWFLNGVTPCQSPEKPTPRSFDADPIRAPHHLGVVELRDGCVVVNPGTPSENVVQIEGRGAPHPNGFVVRVDGTLYLNYDKPIFEQHYSSPWEWWVHKQGVVVEIENYVIRFYPFPKK